MFSNPGSGYDQTAGMFSPDGRVYQIEYAVEAVRRGTTALALRNDDSVIFAVEKKITSLQERLGSEKIFKIDGHIGAAIAGLTADARQLIDDARVRAQVNLLYYDEKATVEEITKELMDKAQEYTQGMGRRPYGVSLLLGGISNGVPKIYQTDPSGAFWGYYACAIGSGQQTAKQYLEANYKKSMSHEDLLDLSIKTLSNIFENEISSDNCDIAYIKIDKNFTMLTAEEKNKLIEKNK